MGVRHSIPVRYPSDTIPPFRSWFSDGRTVQVPLSWYPRLLHGTEAERQNWELWPDGYAIEWLDLDEHLSAKGLAAGNRSGESAKSLERWLGGRKKGGSA